MERSNLTASSLQIGYTRWLRLAKKVSQLVSMVSFSSQGEVTHIYKTNLHLWIPITASRCMITSSLKRPKNPKWPRIAYTTTHWRWRETTSAGQNFTTIVALIHCQYCQSLFVAEMNDKWQICCSRNLTCSHGFEFRARSRRKIIW